MKPLPKLKATHQMMLAPFMDVAAWQLDLTTPQPSWCKNIKHINGLWRVVSKDQKEVTAISGDWAVASIDENSMCILTDTEFKKLYRAIPPK